MAFMDGCGPTAPLGALEGRGAKCKPHSHYGLLRMVEDLISETTQHWVMTGQQLERK